MILVLNKYKTLVTCSLLLTATVLFSGCKTSADATGLKDATASQPDCSQFSNAVGDPVDWLKQQDQSTLDAVFLCAPASTATPIGLGQGKGSLYQAWPLWNDLQSDVGTYIWGGKRLYLQPDGKTTCLLNEMEDSQTERYMAHVYIQPSSRDNKPVVVLDYRVDNTTGPAATPAQLVVDQIVHGIRDEIREITQNGVGTHVFIGRANIRTTAFVNGDLSNISDADFTNPDLYTFGANFFLDFRPTTVAPFGATTAPCVPSAQQGS